MMRLAIIAGVLLTGASAAAQPVARPTPGANASTKAAQPAAPNTARADGGLLRGLDKITGTTRDLPLRVGEAVSFGRLEVRMGECRYPAEDPDSDAFAELTITDTAVRRTVFAGWMIASSPAISALDDARYDIWVVSCGTTKPTVAVDPRTGADEHEPAEGDLGQGEAAPGPQQPQQQ